MKDRSLVTGQTARDSRSSARPPQGATKNSAPLAEVRSIQPQVAPNRSFANVPVESPDHPRERAAIDLAASVNTGRGLPEVLAAVQSRTGYNLAQTRIHADTVAEQNGRALGAKAFALGNEVYVRPKYFRPETEEGRRLIAHEMAHVGQVRGAADAIRCTPEYTAAQRAAMHEQRVAADASDTASATSLGLVPGDIAFRMGSSALAAIIGQAVTHGGIFIGDGLIHDMVAFGNRNVGVHHFYNERGVDPNTVHVVRFTGAHANVILPILLRNLRGGVFRLPTDSVPFNLFSSADDYRTATCLEYAHAQFLFAISQARVSPDIPADVRESIGRIYFRAGASDPSNLIRPSTLQYSSPVDLSPPTGGGMQGGYPMQGGPSIPASMIRSAMVSAATSMADDTDPRLFSNRWEGQSTLENIGRWWWPMYMQTESIRTFTYQSFVDSRQFFQVVR